MNFKSTTLREEASQQRPYILYYFINMKCPMSRRGKSMKTECRSVVAQGWSGWGLRGEWESDS